MNTWFLIKLKTVDQIPDENTPRSYRNREYVKEVSDKLFNFSRVKCGEHKKWFASSDSDFSKCIWTFFPSSHPDHMIYFVVNKWARNTFNLNDQNIAVDYVASI